MVEKMKYSKETKLKGYIKKLSEANLRLKESGEWFRRFFENEPGYCYMVSPDGILLDINQTALKALGYKKNELVGKPLKTIYPPESILKMKQLFVKWKKSGKLRNEEIVIITKEGKRRTVILNVNSFKSKDGKVLHSVSVQRDVTELKKAEEKLRTSEEQFRKIFEYSNDAIFVIDPAKDKIIDANRKASKMLGYGHAELLSLPVSAIHPKEMLKLKEFAKSVFKEGSGWTNELTCLTKKGDCLPAEISASVILLNQRPHMLALVRDISERVKIEEKQRTLSTAIEQATETIIITDLDGNIIYVNPAFEKITGYKTSDILGKNPRILKSEKQDKEFYKKLWDTITSGNVWHGEFINKKKNGELYIEEATITPVFDENNKITNFLAIKYDITERKKTEEDLKESEENYRSIIGAAGNIILIISKNYKILEWNKEAEKIYGWSKNEVLGKNYLKLFIPIKFREAIAADIRKVLKGTPTRDFENPIISKSGTKYIVRWQITPLSIIGKKSEAIIAVGENITIIKKAEEELKEQATFVMENPAPVLQTEINGTIISFNHIAEIIFDKKLKGRPIHSIFPSLKISVINNIIKDKQFQLEQSIKENTFLFTFKKDLQTNSIYIYGADITERKKAEQELLSSKEKLQERAAELEELNIKLEDKNIDLEKFKRLTVGRELRMMEIEEENEMLKKEVEELKKGVKG